MTHHLGAMIVMIDRHECIRCTSSRPDGRPDGPSPSSHARRLRALRVLTAVLTARHFQALRVTFRFCAS